MNILVTENLKKYYRMGENVVKALDGVSISIQQGEFLAIVGKSGSGKSTLLHMLGGLDRPTSGKVMIEQKDISSMDKDELTIFRRRKIGFVFQTASVHRRGMSMRLSKCWALETKSLPCPPNFPEASSRGWR